ncbi:MAG: AAA family ATPase, partial [Verrucomicrobiota bacterium]|nr:AAA family ATPase [Verrucomicrobiota bacterium]
PDVFNILLQVLDDGRLTDGQGRTVNFTNCVLIMTSNIPGEPADVFRPEFINRVDEIIIFNRLSDEDLKKIVEIQLHRLTKRLANQKILLELSDAAKARIARVGHDPVYGARPLKRAVQKEILDPLSLQILEGKIHEGQTVKIDEQDGKLTFSATS